MTNKTDSQKVSELRAVLKIAREHIEQYRAYSEEMRKIGRGCMVLSAYQPETLATIMREALKGAR
jgi:hypothetical protein